MPTKVGNAVLQKVHAAIGDFSILDLFPVLDMREDKLVEVRGAFGYEVKLTKIDHVGRHRKGPAHGGPRKDSYTTLERKGGKGERKDSYGEREQRDRKDSHHSGKGHARAGRRKESTEEYYVKKDEKPVQEKASEQSKGNKRHSRRKNSDDDVVWTPKQAQDTQEKKAESQDNK